MVDLYPLSIAVGIVIGIAVTVVHYRVGWKNVFDERDDEHAKKHI